MRLDLVQRRAREAGAALAYCNLVGGQDELVFDGDSILVSASGELLARGPQFEEALIIADLELPSAEAGPGPETVADERDIQPARGRRAAAYVRCGRGGGRGRRYRDHHRARGAA